MTEAEIKENEDEEEDESVYRTIYPEDLQHVPLKTFKRYPTDVMVERSHEFYVDMNNRRTLRYFSSEEVPKEVIENLIRTAGELCKRRCTNRETEGNTRVGFIVIMMMIKLNFHRDVTQRSPYGALDICGSDGSRY